MSEDVGKTGRQRQLALDFPAPGPTLDGLAVSASNRTAISVLRRWPDWRTHTLAVVGQAKSGLTTVARAWAAHPLNAILLALLFVLMELVTLHMACQMWVN